MALNQGYTLLFHKFKILEYLLKQTHKESWAFPSGDLPGWGTITRFIQIQIPLFVPHGNIYNASGAKTQRKNWNKNKKSIKKNLYIYILLRREKGKQTKRETDRKVVIDPICFYGYQVHLATKTSQNGTPNWDPTCWVMQIDPKCQMKNKQQMWEYVDRYIRCIGRHLYGMYLIKILWLSNTKTSWCAPSQPLCPENNLEKGKRKNVSHIRKNQLNQQSNFNCYLALNRNYAGKHNSDPVTRGRPQKEHRQGKLDSRCDQGLFCLSLRHWKDLKTQNC